MFLEFLQKLTKMYLFIYSDLVTKYKRVLLEQSIDFVKMSQFDRLL